MGKWFEGGQALGVGEWQKIAIAQASLHDGQFIILEETGSALGPKPEYETVEHFHVLVRGQTRRCHQSQLANVESSAKSRWVTTVLTINGEIEKRSPSSVITAETSALAEYRVMECYLPARTAHDTRRRH